MASYRDGANRGGFEPGLEMAIRSILVSPDFLFRLESQPAGRCTQHGLSRQRSRSGLAAVVFPLEQHSGRRAAESGGEEDAAEARSAAAAGAPDAGGSAFAGARRQFRGPVAVTSATWPGTSRARKCCSTTTTICAGRSSRRRSCSSKASSARIAACSICWMPTTRISTSASRSTTAFPACSASVSGVCRCRPTVRAAACSARARFSCRRPIRIGRLRSFAGSGFWRTSSVRPRHRRRRTCPI